MMKKKPPWPQSKLRHLDGRTILFLHVPKTGGKSIKSILPIQGTHHRLAAYAGMIDRDQTCVVSFVRNPWDRLVSTYFYWTTGMVTNSSTVLANRYDGFEEFCLGLETSKICFYLNPLDDDMYGALLRPQSFWLKNEAGQIDVDYVFRFEKFEDEMKRFYSLMGMEFCGLPHINRSAHEPYQTYYTGCSRAVVERVYKEDIEAFGYSFGDT